MSLSDGLSVQAKLNVTCPLFRVLSPVSISPVFVFPAVTVPRSMDLPL